MENVWRTSYGRFIMINFNNKKTQKRIAAVICIILSLAMVIGLLVTYMG